MDRQGFRSANLNTLSDIVRFTLSGSEVVFPILVDTVDTTAISQASITIMNMSECQVVAKVECSNPHRYKCDAEVAVLDRMQEVNLNLTMLGSSDESHRGDTGTATDPDAIVPIDEEGNVMDSVRISTIMSPKAVWDINVLPGK